VLKKLAEELELPKLNFQVLRRTMATLAQTKGGVKDVQGVLGHSKADTTVNVYISVDRGGRETNARRDLCGTDDAEMRPSL
jgi:integrase